MRKFAFSSALVLLTTGLAGAEITVSGDARMGLVNGFALGGGADATTFTSRARLTFTLTGATDSGLEFGASFRADSAIGAATGTAGEVHVSGAFGRLSMGDVGSAAAAAVGHVDGVGLTGLGDLNEGFLLGDGGLRYSSLILGGAIDPANPDLSLPFTGNPTALYEYSAGPLSLYASVTMPGYTVMTPVGLYDGNSHAIGTAYRLGAYRLSFAYERHAIVRAFPDVPDDYISDQVILGADATFGAVTVKLRHGKGTIDMTDPNVGPIYDHDHWALSAAYSRDGLSLTGFVSRRSAVESNGGTNVQAIRAVGLGAAYDPGGGAEVKGGVVRQDMTIGFLPEVSDTAFDLGLSFEF